MACSGSNPDGTKNRPSTVFDSAPQKPRTDEVKIGDFVVQLEKKYRREAIRNSIDLHFSAPTPGHILIRITYDGSADPTKANSIADAAVELAKRLKREDPELRDVDIQVDKSVDRRDD